MTEDEMRAALTRELNLYRTWTYENLIDKVSGAHFGHIEAKHQDGTCYQISFDAFWDDKPSENVRICGSLWAEPQKCRQILGLSIYSPHVANDFIMAPDGKFVGEN